MAKHEPLEWDELKDFILEQIKRTGRRFDVDKAKTYVRQRGGNIDRFLDQLADRGFLSHSEKTRPGMSPTDFPFPGRERSRRATLRSGAAHEEGVQKTSYLQFAKYRKRIFRKVNHDASALWAHLSSFIGVNGFLLLIWAITGAGFPWFLFPLAGWGIGLISHFDTLAQNRKNRSEVEFMPELTDKETRLLKRFHSTRASFSGHLVAAISVSAFLLMVNVITGFGFPWFLFPAGGLGVSLFIHWASVAPRLFRMKKEMKKWLSEPGPAQRHPDLTASVDDISEEPAIIQEAFAVRRMILKQIENLDTEHSNIGSDMKPLLENYYDQIRKLAYKKRDVDELIAGIPLKEIEKDRENLIQRKDLAGNDSLRIEYEKSIADVEKQIRSIRDLESNRELLSLRILSAVNLMKQLQLDLARVKGLAATEASSFDLLKSKSEELSRYLEDLEAGYGELNDDG